MSLSILTDGTGLVPVGHYVCKCKKISRNPKSFQFILDVPGFSKR